MAKIQTTVEMQEVNLPVSVTNRLAKVRAGGVL